MPIIYELGSCLFGLFYSFLAALVIFPVSIWLIRKSRWRAFRYKWLIPALLTLAVFCSVTYHFLNLSFAGPPSPKSQPNEGDIIGTWQMQERTLQYLQETGKYPALHARMQFRDDRTVIIDEVPAVALNIGGVTQAKFYSGTGTWSIRKDLNHEWAVEVRILAPHNSSTDGITTLNLFGETAPYDLYNWDDPDAGSMWVFKKQ